VTDDQADRIAQAVLAVPGVAALHAGMFGEVGTYLPGRRIAGVRVGAEAVDVHVSLVFDVPVRVTAAAIRRAVHALTPLPVNVTVEDVVPAAPAEMLPDTRGAS
jgi:uncharacterized alkaline shock family protein YloU